MYILSFIIAYLAVGWAYAKTWYWQAERNDRKEVGEDLDAAFGELDKKSYRYFMAATTLLWPLAIFVGIAGAVSRRAK